MNGLKAHLWKEWRDRKALLIGIAIALPILDLIVLAAFGERFGKVFGDPSSGTAYSFEGVVALPAAVLVFLFTIAADLFGTERRQGTLTLLQRVPGGTLRAFGAKMLFLVATLSAVLIWQIASVMFAWLCLGEASRAWLVARTAGLHLQEPELLIWFLTAALSLSLWIALVSNWIPRSGAAAVGALALLAVLFSGVCWVLQAYPFFWPVHVTKHSSNMPWVTKLSWAFAFPVALAISSLLLSAVTFLRWSRYERAAWSVAWRGLLVIAVMAGVGYGFGAKSLYDYIRVDPADSDFEITRAVIGAGERYAVIEPSKIPRDLGSSEFLRLPVTIGEPPWRIDLETGRWSRLGRTGGNLCEDTLAIQTTSLAPWLVRESSTPKHMAIRWLDLASGEQSKVTTWDSALSSSRWKTLAQDRAWQRDSLGRTVWQHEGQVYREEADGRIEVIGTFDWSTQDRWVALPDGWLVLHRGEDAYRRIDLEARDLGPVPGGAIANAFPDKLPIPLSIHVAWLRLPASDPPIPGRVIDLATGEDEPCSAPGRVLAGATADYLLLIEADSEELIYWNPGTGDRKAIAWDQEVGPTPNAWSPITMRVHPRTLERSTSAEAVIVLADTLKNRFAIGVLDLESARGRVMTPWRTRSSYSPVCVTETGALWCIEESRRLVRFENGERKVFFPREDS